MSKNRHTIEHLKVACRHVQELMAVGVTENHAIRTLELLSYFYAKLILEGPAAPHHVSQVPRAQWSLAAKKLLAENPDAKPRDHFRVEHGTPRRGFARMVLKLYEQGDLSEQAMRRLVDRYWKLAVITLDEDAVLARVARSMVYERPEERWHAAGIVFGDVDQSISN